MLKTVDILLGVSVVMLIVSMAITVITQSIVALFNDRGRNLHRGLSDLLCQIDPTIESPIAGRIVSTVLTHPMISGMGGRTGSTIHREEFLKLLMDIASNNAPKEVLEKLKDAEKTALTTLLEKNGISDPAKVLDNVRAMALQLEMASPEMASHARHAMAMMHEAQSKMVAKVNAWFDQTMDRVSERFTHRTQIITAVASLLVAFTVQLDVIGLINHLASDEKFRQALVERAIALDKSNSPTTEANKNFQLTSEQRENIEKLADAGVLHLPDSFAEWQARWTMFKYTDDEDEPVDKETSEARKSITTGQEVSVIGVLLSALLLSLGAPFWYNALKNLVRLRSMLASKDDDQRKTRQEAQPTAPTATTKPAQDVLTGEKGILG